MECAFRFLSAQLGSAQIDLVVRTNLSLTDTRTRENTQTHEQNEGEEQEGKESRRQYRIVGLVGVNSAVSEFSWLDRRFVFGLAEAGKIHLITT